MTGQVAMAIDGEWRAGMIDDSNSKVNYGVAPFPVPDDQADQYGKGYITGTIVGIASTSQKQNAAWEFVKYLTTDTDAVVNFANAIHNVPSTIAALASPKRRPGPELPDVHQDRAEPGQQHDAVQPERRRLPADPAEPRLRLRVRQADRPAGRPGRGGPPDRHRHRPGAVTDGRDAGRGPTGDDPALRSRAPAASCCATWRSSRRGCSAPACSSSTRWSRTAYLSFTQYDGFASPTWNGLDNWTFVFRDYPFFWPALRNTLWFVVVIVTLRIVVGLVLGHARDHASSAGSSVLRTLFYAPYLAPPVAATLAFVFLLNPGTGPVNSILGKLGLPAAGLVQRPAPGPSPR